jgi:hypothetical protein
MEDDKKKEKKINDDRTDQNCPHGREKIEPLNKKETVEEKAKREGWTDIAETHLGIDE